MALFMSQPQNLTEDVLTSLTNKLDKAPEVAEVAISDDGSSSVDEVTFVEGGRITTSFVCEHEPVRSDLHKRTVVLRQDMQSHLRSVMKCGDDMLYKIREIVESLDIANHERDLAKAELKDAIHERDQIKIRYETITKEVSVLRIRILEMSKARDRAEIALEVAQGKLLEKEQQCLELREDNVRLHNQITELSSKLLVYTQRCADADGKVRQLRSDIHKVTIEIETIKKELKSANHTNVELGKELSSALLKNKELHKRAEQLSIDLKIARNRLESIESELRLAKQEVLECIELRDQAYIERDQALKDTKAANLRAEIAITDRDAAFCARNEAINDLEACRIDWLRDSSLLKDAQQTLVTIRITIDKLTHERNCAVQKASDMEHLRDEALENFREADNARHHIDRERLEAIAKREEAERNMVSAQAEVTSLRLDREVIIKEKILVERALATSEKEKHTAIARELQAKDDLIEAERREARAVEYAEECENKFQKAELDLAELQTQYEEALKNEKLAVVSKELAESKLASVTKELESVTRQRDLLMKQLSESQEEVKTVRAELSTLRETNNTTNDKLEQAEKSLKDLTNKYTGPQDKKTNDLVQINNLIFGSVRLTQKATYDAILDSYVNKVAFKATYANLENCRANEGQGDQYLGVFYSVKQKGAWVDQLPIWWKFGDSKVFQPRNIQDTEPEVVPQIKPTGKGAH